MQILLGKRKNFIRFSCVTLKVYFKKKTNFLETISLSETTRELSPHDVKSLPNAIKLPSKIQAINY